MDRTAREEALVILTVFGLNLAFLGFVTVIFLVLGYGGIAGRLAIGFAGLWIGTLASIVLLMFWERVSGIADDTNYTAYVATNLAVSVALVATWVIYSATTLAQARVPFLWLQFPMFFLGFVSSYIAFAVVTTFYDGGIYKVVNLPVALVGYTIAAISLAVSA